MHSANAKGSGQKKSDPLITRVNFPYVQKFLFQEILLIQCLLSVTCFLICEKYIYFFLILFSRTISNSIRKKKKVFFIFQNTRDINLQLESNFKEFLQLYRKFVSPYGLKSTIKRVTLVEGTNWTGSSLALSYLKWQQPR